MQSHPVWSGTRALRVFGVLLVAISAIGLMGQYGGPPIWWEAGSGDRLPLSANFQDKTGNILIYNADGDLATRNHPFFTQMGSNDRACITCHQLSSGMSVTTERLEERWTETQGHDPVFAAIDGSNCPSLPQNERESHSLLLDHGLFRIYQQWPAAGIKAEFNIEVMRDPTGCNTDPVYGLHSKTPTISVYRRPRMVGNMKYLADIRGAFTADGRVTTLEAQAIDAIQKHEEGSTISAEDLNKIVQFEQQIYVAQSQDNNAGDLTEVGGPQGLGPWNLARGSVVRDASAQLLTIAHWTSSDQAKRAFRESVQRGSVLFSSHTFAISDIANLNHGKTAQQGTCATCHSEHMTGANATQAWMDIGTSSLPWAGDRKELPLFKITCAADAESHPYLGRVIYTNDPGRALVTGKCKDVGSLVLQQLRGLAARAPYFTAGQAKDLREVVDYYDKRFSAHYTEQEKQGLVNFMSVL